MQLQCFHASQVVKDNILNSGLERVYHAKTIFETLCVSPWWLEAPPAGNAWERWEGLEEQPTAATDTDCMGLFYILFIMDFFPLILMFLIAH